MWYKFSQVIRTDLIVNPDGSYTIRPGSKFFNAIKQELKQNPGLSNYPSRPINQVYPRPTSTSKAPTQNKQQNTAQPEQKKQYTLNNRQIVEIDQGKVKLIDNTRRTERLSKINWGSTTSHSQILNDLNTPGRFEEYFKGAPEVPQETIQTSQTTPFITPQNMGGFGGQSGQGSFSGFRPN